jgi:hypothetical protein
MATAPTSTVEHRETREHEKSGKSLIVVDLGEAQSHVQVRRLRKGKGKLFNHVERIVNDLIEAGTIKANAQPVVIVVNEMSTLWPFLDDDDD